jgi:hypothetical protein
MSSQGDEDDNDDDETFEEERQSEFITLSQQIRTTKYLKMMKLL